MCMLRESVVARVTLVTIVTYKSGNIDIVSSVTALIGTKFQATIMWARKV